MDIDIQRLSAKPFIAACLTAGFLDSIQISGASYEEAKSALNAAMCLLQSLPMRLTARPSDEEST